MGDVVDMILDGVTCERCSSFIDGEAPGYPRRCEGCITDFDDQPAKRQIKNKKENK